MLPKFFSFGGGEVQPTSVLVTGEYDTSDGLVKGMSKEDQKRPGQMLWLLGLTRLQTQVYPINNFSRMYLYLFFFFFFPDHFSINC